MTVDEFYQQLLADLRVEGVPCAIVGGLACVEFGIVEHTEDCDVLCRSEFAEKVLATLERSRFEDAVCDYRSGLSAPLDQRWLSGGWTCHFNWPAKTLVRPHLDLFGVPLRASADWEGETQGLFAGRHMVAEMKRTRRRKDWDQATAIGLQMLKAGDERGWLHIFDADTMLELVEALPVGSRMIALRPALRVAAERNTILHRVVGTEVEFWMHLDRLRLRIYEAGVSRYSSALRRDERLRAAPLRVQHAVRVEHATQLLPPNPLGDYGVERLISEARAATAVGLDPTLLAWLPDARIHFRNVVLSS